MKNLYTFISPNNKLDNDHRKMLEAQIENSLEYWKSEDIILACNFAYEYKGIKAIELPDLINSQYPENPRAIINSKINVIIYLLENKLIDDFTWYHDFDSWQLAPLDVPPLTDTEDMGVVCYGFYPFKLFSYWGKNRQKLAEITTITEYGFLRRANFGSIFFKPSSLDIFKDILTRMDGDKIYEEDAMSLMLEESEELCQRIRIMNPTYNIGIRCVRTNIEVSAKPIKVVHFPPNKPR